LSFCPNFKNPREYNCSKVSEKAREIQIEKKIHQAIQNPSKNLNIQNKKINKLKQKKRSRFTAI
jgi:hypothetical protein